MAEKKGLLLGPMTEEIHPKWPQVRRLLQLNGRYLYQGWKGEHLYGDSFTTRIKTFTTLKEALAYSMN